jgi:hypothetical protein
VVNIQKKQNQLSVSLELKMTCSAQCGFGDNAVVGSGEYLCPA